MDPRIVTRLACPACSSSLALEPFDEADGVVESGVLLCARCRVWYPIASTVPVLLVFRTPVHDRFAREHAGGLERCTSYGPPAGSPRPGEESVQATFTDEWNRTQASDLSFTYSQDDLRELNRQVWLRRALEDTIGSVLEVGCGGGYEAPALHAVLGGADVFAVDLNLALLETAPRSRAPGLHFVIASLFDLPFRPSSFDLVYSQGVLHHTFSTREALEAIAAFVRPGGQLFVWVYGREDHLGLEGTRRLATGAARLVEAALRPALSRTPPAARDGFFAVASRIAHPLLKPRLRHGAEWHRENTDTYLRDWLSPRYAARHGWNEVIEWLEDLGFEIVDVQSPRAYRKLFGDRLWGVGLTGRRSE